MLANGEFCDKVNDLNKQSFTLLFATVSTMTKKWSSLNEIIEASQQMQYIKNSKVFSPAPILLEKRLHYEIL